MTRLWQPSLPIVVLLREDSPHQLIHNKHHYRVTHIALCWRQRIWWRGIWREYYKLTTHTGLLVVIYLDLLTGEWYLQAVYD